MKFFYYVPRFLSLGISPWSFFWNRRLKGTGLYLRTDTIYLHLVAPIREGRIEQSKQLFRKMFRHTGMTPQEIDDIFQLILLLLRRDRTFRSEYERFVSKVDKWDNNRLSYDQWYVLSTFLESFAMARAALAARVHAENAVIEKKESLFNYKRKYTTFLEKGDFGEAEKYCQRIVTSRFDSLRFKQVFLTMQALCCKDFSHLLKDEGLYSEEFCKFARAHTIEIVGPAPFESEHIENTNDAVFLALNYIPGSSELKQEPRIIHYNGSTSRMIFSMTENEREFLKKTEWIECNSFLKEQWAKILPKEKLTFFSDSIDSIDYLYSNGISANVQKAVFHSIVAGERPVKISQITLYVGNQIYQKEYMQALQEDYEKNDFANYIYWNGWHDLFSNFSFLKNLYMLGWILPDERLKAVIEMSREEYAMQYEHDAFRWFDL